MAWDLTDLRSAIAEVYGLRDESGNVYATPPLVPLALTDAFTAWVNANPNQQHSPEGAAKYQELAAQIGPVTVDELLRRFPLAVDWLERRDRVNTAAEADAWDRYNQGQETGYVPGPNLEKIEAAGGPVPRATPEQTAAAQTGAVVYGGPGGPGGQYSAVSVHNQPPAPRAPTGLTDMPARGVEGAPPLHITPYTVAISSAPPPAMETVRAAADQELRLLIYGQHPEQRELEQLAQLIRAAVAKVGYQPVLDVVLYYATNAPPAEVM